MALFAGEFGGKKNPDQIAGELRSDDARTQHQNVDVVVFHALAGGIGVMAQTRPDARNLIRGD